MAEAQHDGSQPTRRPAFQISTEGMTVEQMKLLRGKRFDSTRSRPTKAKSASR